jgi:hypothetical protein
VGGLWQLMIAVVVAVSIMIGGSSATRADTIWTWSAGSWMYPYGCIEDLNNACVRHQPIALNTASGN